MTPDTPADGALAQCCMCGKAGLSTAEDGGPECELHDGRWVCSSECWDIAVSIIDRLIHSPAETALAAMAEREGVLRSACAPFKDMAHVKMHNADISNVHVIRSIMGAVLSGQLIPLETCNARVAAMVEAAAADCDRMAGEIADAVLTGLPEQARIREGMEAAFTKAAARIRTLVTADHTAALDAMISRAREVKPLVWEDFGGFGAKASGFYQANYLIQKWSGEGRYEVAMSYPGYQTGYDGPRWHPTLEAAKAAAQADYTARIHAVLRANATDASEGER
jgi:hypothetical protein